MASAGKKKMKAVLKIEPWDEMDSKRKAWLLSVPAFKKTFKTIEYSADLELDPRKWDPNKLSKALKTLVRYELKLLDAGAAQWQKKIAKKGPLAQKDAEKEYPAYYKSTVKKIKEKCSEALDELASDLGDNRKGLRDGKASLQKLRNVDLKKIFADPRMDAAAACKNLVAQLGKAGDDDKKKQDAFKTATKAVGLARKGFDSDGKDAQAAIKYLLKTAGDIKKNKEANPILKAFGVKVERLSKHLALFVYKIDEFESELDEVSKTLAAAKIDAAGVKRMAADIASLTALDKSSGKVQAGLMILKSEFGKVEKELK